VNAASGVKGIHSFSGTSLDLMSNIDVMININRV